MKNRRKWKRLIPPVLLLIFLFAAVRENTLPGGQEGDRLAEGFLTIGRIGKAGTKTQRETAGRSEDGQEDYIKWVDFNVSSEALSFACQTDVETYGADCHVDWISLLACTAARYGGDSGGGLTVDSPFF